LDRETQDEAVSAFGAPADLEAAPVELGEGLREGEAEAEASMSRVAVEAVEEHGAALVADPLGVVLDGDLDPTIRGRIPVIQGSAEGELAGVAKFVGAKA